MVTHISYVHIFIHRTRHTFPKMYIRMVIVRSTHKDHNNPCSVHRAYDVGYLTLKHFPQVLLIKVKYTVNRGALVHNLVIYVWCYKKCQYIL